MKPRYCKIIFIHLFIGTILNAEIITYSYGVRDFFNLENGNEMTYASDDLMGYHVPQQTTDLDDNNLWLQRLATFDFENYRGRIIAANILTYIRPYISPDGNPVPYSSENDVIVLGKVGPYNESISGYTSLFANSYSIGLGNNLETANSDQGWENSYFDFPWEEDDPNVSPFLSSGLLVSIDLSNFNSTMTYEHDNFTPSSSLGPMTRINLLDEINRIGSIDINLANDTIWDYIELTLAVIPQLEIAISGNIVTLIWDALGSITLQSSNDLVEWHNETKISPANFSISSQKFFRLSHSGEIPAVEVIEPMDSDGDGYYDYEDSFPNDASEHTDSDADGIGDDSDAFPNDPLEDSDSDGDGVGDNSDLYPFNPNLSQHTYNINGDLIVFSNTVSNGASFNDVNLEFRNYQENPVSLNSLNIDNCTILFNGLLSEYRGKFKNSNLTIGDGVSLYGDLTNSTIYVIGDEVSTYANGFGDNVSVYVSSVFGSATFNLTNSNVSADIYGNYFSGTYENSTVHLEFATDLGPNSGYIFDYNAVNATFINSTITGDFAGVRIEGDFRNSNLSGITNGYLADWSGATLTNSLLPNNVDPVLIQSQGAVINSN
jgi:hypothetical protein